MSRSALNIFLMILLVASLAMKASVQARAPVIEAPSIAPAQMLLDRHGFRTQDPMPGTDPQWLIGERGECRIWIANVSPQGWHRQPVDWFAADKRLRYSFAGVLYESQPISRTMISHYVARAKRYLGIASAPPNVLAIVSSRQCPDNFVPQAELAALSGKGVNR